MISSENGFANVLILVRASSGDRKSLVKSRNGRLNQFIVLFLLFSVVPLTVQCSSCRLLGVAWCTRNMFETSNVFVLPLVYLVETLNEDGSDVGVLTMSLDEAHPLSHYAVHHVAIRDDVNEISEVGNCRIRSQREV